jgi:hypothetical protein
LLFISISYLHPLKFSSIGKGIAAKTLSGINTVGSRKGLKNFDKWTEELSKQIAVRSDEQGMKTLWKANETFVDDDFEEEE